MITYFENEFKELHSYLKATFGNNIVSFNGELNDFGYPVDNCELLFKALSSTDKKIIEANFDSNARLSGLCTVTLLNNQQIYFDFLDKDYATVEYPDGTHYSGQINKLQKHGYGTFIDQEGLEFTGTFINNLAEGEMKVKFLDDQESTATFVKGKKQGTITKDVDNYKATIYYQNDHLISCIYKNEDITIIISEPSDNPFHYISGKGSMLKDQRLFYEGDFVDAKLQGKGIFYSKDGKFKGEFQENKLNGFGIMFDYSGNILRKGYWENNTFIGENKMQSTPKTIVSPSQSACPSFEIKDEFDVVKLKLAINKIENGIVGQRTAINQIANNLLLAYLCEKEPNKPLTSILMTGPTGVGKTETAKQISKHLFNKEPFVVDFANFYGEHMLSSLIGAPSGYKGYEDTPALLQYISDNQATGGVILFEEIDKSDTECLNIFMRMLDEGEIISAKNVPHKLNNFIILATTNMTSHHVNKLGFSNKKESDVKDSLAKESTGMKKEQVARFSLITKYENLTKEDKMALCEMAIKDTIKKLKNINGYNINVEINKEIIEKIVENSNESFGVREIKKQASKVITEQLAQFIRTNPEKNINVKIKSLNEVKITVRKTRKPKETNLSTKTLENSK